MITLGVMNDFVALWLDSNYKDLVEELVSGDSGTCLAAEFVGGYEAPPVAKPTRRELSAVPAFPAKPQSQTQTITARLRLRPDFTFESFVVGDNSKICVAAATAVCRHPGTIYNPFFVYGGSGLGKTHLLQAIANDVALHRPEAKIEYLTSEEFVNLYVEAVQKSTLPAFRRRFRSLDLLLIDDVQFFKGKVQSSEEFFHTFNSLYNAHKQIILAADRTPQEIGLEDRMISRFDWGLSAEILPPELETRVAILKKKQEMQSVKLSDDVLFLVASRIQSNMRMLESALTILTMNVSALGCDMTPELAERLLKDKFDVENRRIVTIDMIQRHVAEKFDVKVSDILGRKRPQNIAQARMVAMYLSRKLTKFSFPVIGDAFNRNHATIVHAVDAIGERMTNDDSLRATVNTITKQLTS